MLSKFSINGEYPVTYQGVLDELNHHQITHGKYKDKISIQRSKRYHRIDLEDICFRFDQVRHMVSHLEVCLPGKSNFLD